MNKLLIASMLILSSCTPMTPEERQAWSDAWLRANTITATVMPIALGAAAYADITNAESLKRASRK
jgi:hypothetical protein